MKKTKQRRKLIKIKGKFWIIKKKNIKIFKNNKERHVKDRNKKSYTCLVAEVVS